MNFLVLLGWGTPFFVVTLTLVANFNGGEVFIPLGIDEHEFCWVNQFVVYFVWVIPFACFFILVSLLFDLLNSK